MIVIFFVFVLIDWSRAFSRPKGARGGLGSICGLCDVGGGGGDISGRGDGRDRWRDRDDRGGLERAAATGGSQMDRGRLLSLDHRLPTTYDDDGAHQQSGRRNRCQNKLTTSLPQSRLPRKIDLVNPDQLPCVLFPARVRGSFLSHRDHRILNFDSSTSNQQPRRKLFEGEDCK